MFGKVKTASLPTYIDKIEDIFPEFRDNSFITNDDIVNYYQESFLGYAFFHSWAGAIHMALSPSGQFLKSDYLRQAEEVEDYIARGHVECPQILEVGCGRGFNVAYLSRSLPTAFVQGIDLTPRNVLAGRKEIKTCPNAEINIGDFNDLRPIDDSSFSYVLAIETLCHSSNPEKTLSELFRVLRPGGSLIVYDGFRSGTPPSDGNVLKAVSYTERAMAVPLFSTVDAFVNSASKAGFSPYSSDDKSAEIMPNLVRLSDLAKAFFKFPLLAKAILRVIPRGLAANAVAGLLMAVTVDIRAHEYRKLIFLKP